MMKIIINIPALPPKEASPNWRGHWSEKYRAMRDYKSLVIVRAREAMRANHPTQPITTATIATTLIVRDARYIKDGDNAIASLKAAIDGIVEAGILKDDKYINVSPVRYEIDRERAPGTIIEVQPMSPGRRTPPHTTQPQRHSEGE